MPPLDGSEVTDNSPDVGNILNSLPSYMVAANNHSIASDNGMDIGGYFKVGSAAAAGAAIGSLVPIPILGTLGGAAIGALIGGQTAYTNGAFAASSLVAGYNSFYNTGVEVANWFGADAQKNDTQQMLSEYDTDYGNYYRAHKESSELAGFLIGSLIPTVGSLKIYNYAAGVLNGAKAAEFGETFSAATGLLRPYQAKYLAAAQSELAAQDGAMKLLNGNMLKAFATGVAEESIQGGVASIATLATMRQSPILENMDNKDLIWNVAEGAALGGVLGGLFRNVQAYGQVNKGVEKLGLEARPYFAGESNVEGSNATQNIIRAQANMRERPALEPLAADATQADKNAYAYKDRKFKEASSKWDQESRISAQDLTHKDAELANMYMDNIAQLKSSDEVANRLNGVTDVSRIGSPTKADKIFNSIDKTDRDNIKALKEGRPGDVKAYDEEQVAALKYTNISYQKLQGEGRGEISNLKPDIINLADGLKAGQKVEVGKNGITVGKERFKFSIEDKERWDPTEKTVRENLARDAWAIGGLKFEVGSNPLIHDTDLAVMRAAHDQGILPKLIRKDGSSVLIGSKQDLIKEISASVDRHIDNINVLREFDVTGKMAKDPEAGNLALAQKLGVRTGYIEGTAVNTANPYSDLFATKSLAEEHTASMIKAGQWTEAKGLIPTWTKPSYAKIITNTAPVKDLNGNVLKGMALLKEQQRIMQIAHDNAVMSVLAENAPEAGLASQFPEFEGGAVFGAPQQGPGQGLISSANQDAGKAGSTVQFMGALTKRIITAFQKTTTDTITNPIVDLGKDNVSSLQFEALNQRLRKTPEPYIWDTDTHEMVLRRVYDAEVAKEAGIAAKVAKILDPNAEERFAVTDPKVAEYLTAKYIRNGQRVSGSSQLAGANGYGSGLDPRVAYPTPRNLKDYPHFAFVVDPSITGAGHTSMIYAATPEELEALITKVSSMPEGYNVITKRESERFHKAMGDYNKADTISDNYIDNTLFRAGVSSDFVPRTDPATIVKHELEWHMEQDRKLARYVMVTKYSKEFAEFKNLADAGTNIASSKAGGVIGKYIESAVPNPFIDYNKMALNIASTNEIPIWSAANRLADQKFSEVYNKVSALWKAPSDITPELVNKVFSEAGLKVASYDAQLMAHANHVAPRGVLEKFVNTAGSVMGTLLLKVDPMNAVNNYITSHVLLAPEMQSLISKIKTGDAATDNVLGRIKLPGTGDDITSPIKLIANAYKDFWQNPNNIKGWMSKNGFMTRSLEEVNNIASDFSMTGAETAQELARKSQEGLSRFQKFGNFAEKYTGNQLAEGLNRFVAAHIAKQITDVAIEQGILTEAQQLARINTFVNRTQGTYIASQRPLLFQGAIGQAVSLFQTYQFNMAQQMLRYVAEGSNKTAALTMGMQSTISGLNGLPGFSQINAHIIGTMSGNPDHKDLYDAVNGVAGKSAGDWLTYGMSSNALGLFHPDLKMNLYTRSDINPRFMTVIPTSLTDVPIVSASAKLFSSLKDSYSKIAAGGNVWQTFLQGVEHAGINRPLAGLAQTLEAFGNPKMQSYSTSNKGNVVASNDLLSIANLTRMAGARPFDEALAVDAAYRLDAYKKYDQNKLDHLGQALKTSVIAGQTPSQEQVEQFASEYAKFGGHQDGFSKWMVNQMKTANTSQANALAQHLKSPLSQSMQNVMGGNYLKDFQNGQ